MITSYKRGHKIYLSDIWRYIDNNEPAEIKRPCIRCGRMPTKEGYDACLGYIENAVSACCGHGVEKPYIIKNMKLD